MLIPVLKLANKATPRALIILPEHDKNDILDLRDNYWKDLKKIDGLSSQEFYRRCNDKQFKEQGDNPEEKESVRMKYSEDRFQFTKSYSMTKNITQQTLTQFMDLAQKNK
jgi:hypothetical protein